MPNPLRILVLEDLATDYELVLRELRKAGLDFTARRAETEGAFRTQLQEFAPDLILADYSLPGYDGLSALTVRWVGFPKKSSVKSTVPSGFFGGAPMSSVVTLNICPAPSASLVVMMGVWT